MIGWLARLLHRPDLEPRETVYAFKVWMQMAADEIEHGGELKPARVIHGNPEPRKTQLDYFKRLSLAFRRRA